MLPLRDARESNPFPGDPGLPLRCPEGRLGPPPEIKLVPPGSELVRDRDQACVQRPNSGRRSKPLFLEFLRGVWRRFIPLARLVHASRRIVAPESGIVHAPTVRWFLGRCLRRESPCPRNQTGQPSILKSNQAGFKDHPPNLFCRQRLAKPGRTVPCISVPALPGRARPSLASPSIACIAGPCPSVPPMPIQTCHAVPCPSKPSYALPCLPRRAKPSFATLCLAAPAAPHRACPRPALPDRALPAAPRRAAPSLALPRLPRQTGPSPAVPCRAGPFHACRAVHSLAAPGLAQPAMRRQPRLRWPPISGRTCEDANTSPSSR